jgi:hypothetical protein
VTVPVFTDPSGQRRRLVRLVGACVSVLCVGALIVVAIALVGGPSSPIGGLWAQTPARHSAPAGAKSGGHHGGGRTAPAAQLIQPGGQGPGGGQASPTRSASSRPNPSPSPTKPHKRQGRNHSKAPHPHPSHSH